MIQPFIQHAGVTVSNLEKTLAFYRDAFGLEAAFITKLDGPVVEAVTGAPGSSLRIAFLPAGGAFVELLEYSVDGGTYELTSTQTGASHIAIGVPDIATAFEQVCSTGAEVVNEPMQIQDGALAGAWYAYVRDPDGVVVELFQSTREIQALLVRPLSTPT